MAGEAEFGFGVGLPQVYGVNRGRAVRRIGLTGKFAVPDRRHRLLRGFMGGMAEGADLRLIGGLHRAAAIGRQGGHYGRGEVVFGIADVRNEFGQGAIGQETAG